MVHSGFHQTDSISSLATGALSALAQGANANIAIKSNTSPDIVINVSDLLSPDADATKSISSSNQSSLQWIRPKIVIRSMGNESAFAPYGEPNSMIFLAIAAGAIVMALLGAKLAMMLCHHLGQG